ncbi:MAG: antibiotic ABC transporter permease, partial [Clostridiales bacterium]|nr:antibiotic ABC transporter permease [Clostridiales bacterium]
MLRKIAHWLTKKPMVVLIVALIALAFSFIGAAATRINYDILTYLPPDFDSSKGEKLLEEPFHSAATTMLIVEDMPPEYTNALCRKIQDVPGVSSALWISSLTGVQIPEDFLPEEIRDTFFAGNSTMMIVQYEMPGSSTETMNAIRDIRNICNEKCFLAGFSVVIKDTKDLVDSELPFYVLLAVALSLIVMCATMESWILPFAVLGSIGFAIMFNFGTNIFLGEISYITKAIAAVLQLGVTTDYSIFLYHRYIEECEKTDNHKDAMAEAIVSSFTALASSSLTTVAGFLALCFMQLLLGRDIGIVMAKGVVLGIATVLLVLPAIILVFDKPIEKYKHRALDIRFEKFNRFIVKHNKAFVVLFILLFIPALYSQNHAEVYYKLDEALPQDMPSIVATNKLKDEYNMASSHFVVMRDDLSHSEMLRLIDELEAEDGVETVVAYDKFASNAIPEFFIPDELREICKQDGMQIMMINSAYPSASDEVGVQVEALNKILKAYDTSA